MGGMKKQNTEKVYNMSIELVYQAKNCELIIILPFWITLNMPNMGAMDAPL